MRAEPIFDLAEANREIDRLFNELEELKDKLWWKPIETIGDRSSGLDLWVRGKAMSVRVPNCYKRNDKWYYLFNGVDPVEIQSIITHWMPTPEMPR